MKIIIAGGTGCLGKALEKYFTAKKDEVIILTRHPVSQNHVYWDGKSIGDWQSSLEHADVLINLSGKSVDCRYTARNKNKIFSSRLDSTAILQKAIDSMIHPPRVWLNASSATIYIHSEHTDMTEEKGITGDDFSMTVCKEWEKTFFNSSLTPVRKVAIRSAIVLSNTGGAFPKLKILSRIGLGGQQGKGTQYFSWIHIEDLCRVVDFLIMNESIRGKVNVCSPFPVSNKTFMSILAKYTHPLFTLAIPTFILKIGAFMIQTETELILKSRRVVPELLLQHGFVFRFPKLDQAIPNLLKEHI